MTNDIQAIETTREERAWGALAHLSGVVGFLVGLSLVVPFGFILGPLVVWMLKKEALPFVDDQGKEAINFQLTMLIWFLICFVLKIVLIGWLLEWIVGVIDVIMVVIAASKAYEGKRYRYPFTFRFLK